MLSIQDIAKGDELFASYGYGFDTGPVWYKELFLEFLSNQGPEDEFMVQKVGGGRTKEELMQVYQDYLKKGSAISGEKISFFYIDLIKWIDLTANSCKTR